MTGHDNGIITVSLVEADDAIREQLRVSIGRTLPHAAWTFPP